VVRDDELAEDNGCWDYEPEPDPEENVRDAALVAGTVKVALDRHGSRWRWPRSRPSLQISRRLPSGAGRSGAGEFVT